MVNRNVRVVLSNVIETIPADCKLRSLLDQQLVDMEYTAPENRDMFWIRIYDVINRNHAEYEHCSWWPTMCGTFRGEETATEKTQT